MAAQELTREQLAYFGHSEPPLPLSPEDYPDVSNLVTENDEPVDNLFSEKQQRLLTHALWASWKGPGGAGSFVAMANIGLFPTVADPTIVPDALLAVHVNLPDDFRPKENRSYFVWMYGKPPDVVIEIVSNRKGNELTDKRQRCERIGVPYYVVYDPFQYLGESVLHVFEKRGGVYEPAPFPFRAPPLELGLDLWEGEFEGHKDRWLRWVDLEGRLILTGEERAQSAEERAQSAEERAQRLAEKLRSLGVNPDDV